jgi:plastocyanin
VTSDIAGDFDVTVSGKSQATFTASTKPGSYPFLCAFHRYMTGILVVK